jgi:hypothetical protein
MTPVTRFVLLVTVAVGLLTSTRVVEAAPFTPGSLLVMQVGDNATSRPEYLSYARCLFRPMIACQTVVRDCRSTSNILTVGHARLYSLRVDSSAG